MKIWINLTKKYCDKKIEDSYGFTIPFIIGLEIEFNDKINYTINNLFEDLNSSNEIFTLSECNDLTELIIDMHKNTYPNINSLKKIDNLVKNTKNFSDVNSIDEVIIILENKYNSKISDKQYSKNYFTQECSDFDIQDKFLISKLINT